MRRLVALLAAAFAAVGLDIPWRWVTGGANGIGRALCQRFIQDGAIEPPYWFQIVLGVRGGAPGTIQQLVQMVQMLPPGTLWSACGIGRSQLPLGVAAMTMGGHVRTGLEDTFYLGDGTKVTSNGQLIEGIVTCARNAGREIASPAEARKILKLMH